MSLSLGGNRGLPAIFVEEADLGKRGADRRLDDAQADFAGRDRLDAHQTAIADARAGTELGPLPVLPLIQREGIYALAQRKIFTEADDVEGGGLARSKTNSGWVTPSSVDQ